LLLRHLGNLTAIPAVLAVVSFVMVHRISSDPVRRITGLDATAEYIAATRHALSLDRPLAERFAVVCRFDWQATSYKNPLV
jgi:ABC-type dipeptide/oligopeptide/nickel transport system permease component